MLDLLHKDGISETLYASGANIIDLKAAVSRLLKNVLTSSSVMVQISTFLG